MAVPRSGCLMISRIGNAGHQHHAHQVPELETLGPAGAVGGDGDDQDQGGELGRLELERPEREPALGPVGCEPDRRSTASRATTIPT